MNVLTTQQIPSDDIIVFQNSKRQQWHDVQNRMGHTINDVDDHVVDFTNNSLLPERLWDDVPSETVNDVDHADDAVSISPSVHDSSVVQHPQPPDSRTMIVSPDHDETPTSNLIKTPAPQMMPQHDKDEVQELDALEQQQQQPDDEEQDFDQYHQQYHPHQHHDVDEYIRSDIVNMLLQWYVAQDLSYDAAYGATCLAENNVILAQYIISSALTQIPICKHLLNDGKCYRADCTFNHNIENHTCVFWMKSRGCSKRHSATDPCRFLHGFSSKILENVPEPIQLQAAAASHTHNNSTITPYKNIRDFYATTSTPTNNTEAMSVAGNIQHNSYYGNTNTINNPKSFAKIASQGYNTQKSFTPSPQDVVPATKSNNNTTSMQQMVQQLPTMLIPQTLWQAHENRDASAFYISDPLERYYSVSSTPSTTAVSSQSHHGSHNVIDLHYQSIKTFPVVLDTILPNQLAQLPPPSDSGGTGKHTNNGGHNGGIWIVTGTGHHVNTQRTHQKGGNTLEHAVLEYLISNYMMPHPSSTNDNNSTVISSNRYRIYKGRDRNGKGGAIYIQRK